MFCLVMREEEGTDERDSSPAVSMLVGLEPLVVRGLGGCYHMVLSVR